MNNLKRIFAILAAIIMTFAYIVSAEGEYTVKNTEEIDFLSALGFADTEKTDFSQNMTRGEFAQIYTKILNKGLIYTGEGKAFADMNEKNEYFSAVSFMSQMGYMNGHSDGTFRPNGNISYDEAVSVIVKILGYGVKANAKGGYPAGYKITANELKLLNGFNASDASALTIDEAFKLIYNSLFIALSEQTEFGKKVSYSSDKGNTLLNTFLEIDYTEGLLEDNSYSSLSGDSNIKDGAISVNGIVMENATNYAKSYLGYNVRAYYKTDDTKAFVYITLLSDKNECITIDAEDILPSATLTLLKYKQGKNKTQKTAKITANAYYIKNGEAIKSLTDSDLKIKSGTVTLLDYDNNKVYDAILIDEYQTVVLQGVNADLDMIYGKYGEKIDLKDADSITVKDKYGVDTSIGALKEYDVLAVYVGNKTAKIEICTDVFVGKLSEITEDYYIIGNANHRLSNEYETSGLRLPEVGDMGTFYFGKDLKLAFYEKSQTKSVGVAVGMTKADSVFGDKKPKVRIYTAEGKFSEFDFQDKFTFCGDRIKSEDIYAYSGLFDANNDFIRQVVLYEIGDTGEISSFDIADPNKGDDKLQSVSAMRSYRHCNTGTDVISPTATLSGEDNRALFISANTYHFKLPKDINAERFYEVSKGSLPYKHDAVISDTQAFFTNSDSKKSAVADIITALVDTTRGTSGEWHNRCTVVESISRGVNPSGEVCDILSGYLDGKLEKFYAIDDTEINGLDAGDVIQLTHYNNEIQKYRKVYSSRHDTNCVDWYLKHNADGRLTEFYNIENPDDVDSLKYYVTKDMLLLPNNYGSRSSGSFNTDLGSMYATGTVTYKNGNYIIVTDNDGKEYNYFLNENEFEYYKTSAVRFSKESQTVEAIKASTVNLYDRVNIVPEAYSVLNVLVIE